MYLNEKLINNSVGGIFPLCCMRFTNESELISFPCIFKNFEIKQFVQIGLDFIRISIILTIQMPEPMHLPGTFI